jgi:D-3-phosphoglycerate dehydrogenase
VSFKVLIPDLLEDGTLAELRSRYDVDYCPGISQHDLASAVRGAEILVVRSAVQVDRMVLESATELCLVIRAGSGLDNIDLDAALELGVSVRNLPDVSANSVAELTVGLLLAATRRIAFLDNGLRCGQWLKSESLGVDLEGRTVGLIGLGHIGRRVAELLSAFGMTVVAATKTGLPGTMRGAIELVSFGELMQSSHVVSLHLPLTPESRELVDTESLALMRSDAILINTARAGIVNHHALVSALASGRLLAAALDVPATEALPALVNLHNVVLTPHIGAMTRGVQGRIGRRVVEIIEAFAGK